MVVITIGNYSSRNPARIVVFEGGSDIGYSQNIPYAGIGSVTSLSSNITLVTDPGVILTNISGQELNGKEKSSGQTYYDISSSGIYYLGDRGVRTGGANHSKNIHIFRQALYASPK